VRVGGEGALWGALGLGWVMCEFRGVWLIDDACM